MHEVRSLLSHSLDWNIRLVMQTEVLDFILVIYVTQAIEQGRQISDEVC